MCLEFTGDVERIRKWGKGVAVCQTQNMNAPKGERDIYLQLPPAPRVTPSHAARARVRLLRAAARAYTAWATTSVGPPVNHADPPHFPTPFLQTQADVVLLP